MTKRGSSFRYESSHVLRERVSIELFDRGTVFVYKGCRENFLYLFFSFFLDKLFLHCDSKPCTLIDLYIYIYILRLLLHSFTYLFVCCFFSLFMYVLLIYCMQSFISVSH